jgi:hypothetical protein
LPFCLLSVRFFRQWQSFLLLKYYVETYIFHFSILYLI